MRHLTAWLSRTLVVIPALNEVESVGNTVREWRNLGVGLVRVVDNNSSDGTAEAARVAGAEVLLEPDRGYGAAAWRGLEAWPACYEWVLFSSADGSDFLSPEDVSKWGQSIADGSVMIVGDRTTHAHSRSHLKPIQRLGNWVTCTAIHWGWKRRFKDMGSLRLIRHDALLQLNLRNRLFGWNVEMQIKAIEMGLQIAELPVAYRPRSVGASKISGNLIGSWRAGCGILRVLWQLWKWRHP